MIRNLIIAMGMLCIAGPGFGESLLESSWPQFRGPLGNGHANQPQTPVAWSSSENVVWRVETEGEGWSSPVIDGNVLYLTAAVPERDDGDYSLRLYRFDAITGEPVWQTEVFREDGDSSPGIHPKNSHASPTPIVDGGQVFVHFGHQGTACLDTEGKILWKTREHTYQPVHGAGGSPVLFGEALIFNADGGRDPFLVALDRHSGQVRWKVARQTDSRKTFSFCTPTLIEVDGRPQLVSPGSNVVAAYDPATGDRIWWVRYDGYSVIPKPVFSEGMIFISTGYDSPRLIAIRVAGALGDVTDTHVAWTAARGAPNTPSMLAVDGLLYLVSDAGVASCLQAESGDLVWRQRLGGNFSASPVLAGGRIYFLNESGECFVVRAGREYELLAKNELGERTLASPAIAHGSIYVRTAEHLYRIGER